MDKLNLKELSDKFDAVLESITHQDVIDYFNYIPTPAEQTLINNIEVN